MLWDWAFVWRIFPLLMEGLKITVQATVLGMALAMVVGLMLALLRRSRFRTVSMPTRGFIEFVRSTPLLVQLFFAFFVLPTYGIRFSPMVTGLLVLGLHYGTYTSEVYRAGIEGIGRGQWEASRALNFSTWHSWTRIILPQAIPPMFPVFGNYLIAMFKDTPLLSTITVVELLLVARELCSETFKCFEPMTLVGFLFFLVSYPSALLVRRIEVRFGRGAI